MFALFDCTFGTIDDPVALDERLRAIHGVVATGLFARTLVAEVLIGTPDGVRTL